MFYWCFSTFYVGKTSIKHSNKIKTMRLGMTLTTLLLKSALTQRTSARLRVFISITDIRARANQRNGILFLVHWTQTDKTDTSQNRFADLLITWVRQWSWLTNHITLHESYNGADWIDDCIIRVRTGLLT